MRDDITLDRRVSARSRVIKEVRINGGIPFEGGRLRDISATGAAIEYPDNISAVGEPPEIGASIVLESDESSRWPGRVVRHFDGGYAVRFDWEQTVVARPFD